jgi:predicted esterase
MKITQRILLNGIAIVLLIPVFLLTLQVSLLEQTPVQFTSAEDIKLLGTIYPGDQPAGIILLEGFGSDQVNMTSLLIEFKQAGFNVFTFDFSGHGRSDGTLGFDNAKTDTQARQLIQAMDEFKNQTGLENSQIVLLGHSLGARVALQAAGMLPSPPTGLILLGTQVNLSTNVQSEFFTGTSDTDLDWVQNLSPTQPATNIVLMSGTWDDILTPSAANLLIEKLSGKAIPAGEPTGFIENNTYRSYVIFPRVLHNYEVFTPSIIEKSVQIAQNFTQLQTESYHQQFAALRIWAWLFGLIGLFLLVIGNAGSAQPTNKNKLRLEITNASKFLWRKLFLWFPALLVGALIAGLFFLVPAGFPAFNMIYIAFLGGYGIVLLLFYWRGWMPGTSGKLPFTEKSKPSSSKRIFLAISAAAILLLLTTIYTRSGWFFIYPFKNRLVWLVLFSLFTALGFWIGQSENQMLTQTNGVTRFHKIALQLIGLFPFFLWAALLAGLGSLSGLTGAVQGLIILAFVILSGKVFQTLGQRAWLTALLQAILLYWLILPQGVLFGM